MPLNNVCEAVLDKPERGQSLAAQLAHLARYHLTSSPKALPANFIMN